MLGEEPVLAGPEVDEPAAAGRGGPGAGRRTSPPLAVASRRGRGVRTWCPERIRAGRSGRPARHRSRSHPALQEPVVLQEGARHIGHVGLVDHDLDAQLGERLGRQGRVDGVDRLGEVGRRGVGQLLRRDAPSCSEPAAGAMSSSSSTKLKVTMSGWVVQTWATSIDLVVEGIGHLGAARAQASRRRAALMSMPYTSFRPGPQTAFSGQPCARPQTSWSATAARSVMVARPRSVAVSCRTANPSASVPGREVEGDPALIRQRLLQVVPRLLRDRRAGRLTRSACGSEARRGTRGSD